MSMDLRLFYVRCRHTRHCFRRRKDFRSRSAARFATLGVHCFATDGGCRPRLVYDEGRLASESLIKRHHQREVCESCRCQRMGYLIQCVSRWLRVRILHALTFVFMFPLSYGFLFTHRPQAVVNTNHVRGIGAERKRESGRSLGFGRIRARGSDTRASRASRPQSAFPPDACPSPWRGHVDDVDTPKPQLEPRNPQLARVAGCTPSSVSGGEKSPARSAKFSGGFTHPAGARRAAADTASSPADSGVEDTVVASSQDHVHIERALAARAAVDVVRKPIPRIQLVTGEWVRFPDLAVMKHITHETCPTGVRMVRLLLPRVRLVLNHAHSTAQRSAGPALCLICLACGCCRASASCVNLRRRVAMQGQTPGRPHLVL